MRRASTRCGGAAGRAIPQVALARQADHLLLFTADPTSSSALANLLHNAVVHAGGVDALVVTSTPDVARFEVLDRGPGLPAGEEGKVFAFFYRPEGAA